MIFDVVTNKLFKDLLAGTVPAGDAKKLNGLTAEEFVSNENLLINSDFRNPVNSSGKTSWANDYGKICIDNWYYVYNKADGATATLVENGIQLTVDASISTYTGLYQFVKLETGKKYMLSVSVDGVVYTKSITGGSYITGGATIATGITIYYASNDALHIRVTKDLSSAVLNWTKLELGSVATPFIPPNKEVEKLKCGVVDNATHTATDLNAEYTNSNGFSVCRYTGNTLNTPYKEGLTNYSVGKCITIKDSASYGMQMALIAGSKKVLTRSIDNGVYGAWGNSADGGNADTVDGLHASEFVRNTQGYGWSSVNFGSHDINTWIKDGVYAYSTDCTNKPHGDYGTIFVMSPMVSKIYQISYDWNEDNQPLRVRGSNNGGTTWSEWRYLNANILAKYLPLDGSVPMSGYFLYLFNKYGAIYTDTNKTTVNSYNSNTDLTNARSLMVLNSNQVADVGKAFIARDVVNGTATDYTVLHTGNSQKVAITDSVDTPPSTMEGLWAY